ncbi:uncharacterized protein LOC109862005 [Pseudomyrmex gracilis]|uniref:uncharacterized protein LOC109862005 n=1 Tax=Pseudomyrmex gracilis TaxID=219809 RepID=UPI000995BCE6|nr:uncharacterized protein LOC109862005 [Pseudomyrmex gracilis]
MDERLRLIVYRNNAIFDDVIVRLQRVSRYDEICGREFASSAEDNVENNKCKKITEPVSLCTKGLNSYLVSAYVATLSRSYVYRKSAMRVLIKFQKKHSRSQAEKYVHIIFVRLRTPKKQFLDYKWNERLMQIVIEKQEADHAMSWLSTLGGAFSALGEEFTNCAEIAGKISVKQLELALRLNNPLLVARCKLYTALSLIQRDQFITPQHIIKRIYKLALKEKDVRLQNMCHGIWAKLRYSYKQYKQRKKFVSFKTLHISAKT